MEALAEVLAAEGFKTDNKVQGYLDEVADGAGMRQNGDYVLHHVWRKGDVTVTVEQNTAPEELAGGMSAIVTHPPCAIIDGPDGYRVAFNPQDTNLALTLLADLQK